MRQVMPLRNARIPPFFGSQWSQTLDSHLEIASSINKGLLPARV